MRKIIWFSKKRFVEIVNNNTTYHYVGILLHRKNGPAVIYNDGEKVWYSHGVSCRKDGPARTYLHRLDLDKWSYKDKESYYITEEGYWNE